MDASTAPRSSRSTQLGREQILNATVRCLHEYGYDGTTIRQIALILGCAVGSIYRYFTDKRNLLSEVTERQLEAVVVLISSGSPFAESVQLYVKQAEAGPQMYRLMFWLTCVGQDRRAAGGLIKVNSVEVSEILTARPASFTPRVPDVVAKIIAGWAERLGDKELAEQCWATLHGLLMLGYGGDQAIRAALALTKGHIELYAPFRQMPERRLSVQTNTLGVAELRKPATLVGSGIGDDQITHLASLGETTSGEQDAVDTSNDDVCLL